MSLEAELAGGLDALGIGVAPKVAQRLLEYVRLIGKWNRVYNLTAVRSDEAMLTHHLLDSAAVAAHVAGDSLLDVGSGAGLPGIPLAILKPRMHVTLLDSNNKKASFLRQAVMELELERVEVAAARVEQWRAPREYDVVISRAFSELADFARLAGRHCSRAGALLAMKGVYPREELARIPPPFSVAASIPLHVPGLDAERHLIVMRRAAAQLA